MLDVAVSQPRSPLSSAPYTIRVAYFPHFKVKACANVIVRRAYLYESWCRRRWFCCRFFFLARSRQLYRSSLRAYIFKAIDVAIPPRIYIFLLFFLLAKRIVCSVRLATESHTLTYAGLLIRRSPLFRVLPTRFTHYPEICGSKFENRTRTLHTSMIRYCSHTLCTDTYDYERKILLGLYSSCRADDQIALCEGIPRGMLFNIASCLNLFSMLCIYWLARIGFFSWLDISEGIPKGLAKVYFFWTRVDMWIFF